MSTIFTLGYAGLKLSDVKAWLESHSVLLVDVRFVPWSRNSQWKRENLQATLGDRYVWLRAMGNRNWRDPSMEAVELADPERGVRIASRLLQKNSICLLCLESDGPDGGHWRCHRAEVADLIAAETGATVQPLTAADLSSQGRLAL